MILEAISFKLAQDFFIYLKKNRIVATDIKIDFFDRNRHEFVDFSTIDNMISFFGENYIPIDTCFLGDLGAIQFFRAVSDTYNFEISYKMIDVSNKVTIIQETTFDNQRNQQRQVFKDRQLTFIKQTINEYVNFLNEIRAIYATGIYSPCYAEPGWSQNTWYLKSLRESFISPRNSSQFPYKNAKINKFPPR